MKILWILSVYLFVHRWEFVSCKVVSAKIEVPANVFEGNDSTLTCVATCNNNSACSYQWSGYNIPQSTNTKTVTLTLTNVNREYKDKSYTCDVTDTGDNDKRSATNSFDVFFGPNNVSVAAGSRPNVTEGESYRNQGLTCKASECNPPCNTFKWVRSEVEGSIISNKARLFPEDQIINRKDAGSYECTASNAKNLNNMFKIALTVHYPPNVTFTWADDTLKCEAKGNPDKNYVFQTFKQSIKSKPLKEYNPIQSGNIASLKFSNKNYQMTGDYLCSVSNGIGGNQSKSRNIKVEDQPKIVQFREGYNVSKGSNLDISLELYSLPVVKRSGIRVESAHDNSFSINLFDKDVMVNFHGTTVSMLGQILILSLRNVSEEDFTNYTVVIGNTLGNVPSSFTIFPEGPPDVPKFNKDVTSPHSVSFVLVTGYYNGGNQTLVIEHRLEGQTEWSNKTYRDVGRKKNEHVNLKVSGLVPETVYEFRAYAYNTYDRSNYTEIIKETTEEEPSYAGAIAGGVVGGIALLLIITAIVILILRRRRKKEMTGGQNRALNKDLTLKMPTSPVYENNCPSVENMLAEGESPCPVSPDPVSNVSNIYENTNMKASDMDNDNTVPIYDIPPSNKEIPRDNAESTMPPYLDLNNPNPVEEAYVGVVQLNSLVQQGKQKENISHQGTISEGDYLDMNEVNKVKESHYVNSKTSSDSNEHVDDGQDKDGKDYQNVGHFKKSKHPPAVAKKPKQKNKKVLKKTVSDIEEGESKDYQNVDKYKKVTKEPSVESAELYMTMSTETSRESVTSMPEFLAPPPPTVQEEDYMNIRMGKSK